MKANSKVIFTMTEPDDLYIIGDFPYDKNLEKIIFEKLGDRFVQITDDYATIYVKGKSRSKTSNSCETVGTFILVTKTEWDDFVKPLFQNHKDYRFEDLHDEPYAIVVKQYVGLVEVDIVDEEGVSYLNEFDIQKDLSHQAIDNDDLYLMEVVHLDSGFSTTATMLQVLYGYKQKITTDIKYVYQNDDTGKELIGSWKDVENKKYTEIGTVKTITTKWVKS